MLLVLRGDEQGLGVKINRIVLQTLTFTSGTWGIAPANHGSILLSDSRHGNYLINKARSWFSQPPFLLLFFLPNPNDFLYDLLILISNVRYSDCIKSPLGDLMLRNEESKVRPLIHWKIDYLCILSVNGDHWIFLSLNYI